jgi:predicted transcriptional regulator
MLNDDKTQVSLRVPAAMLSDMERIAKGLERDRTWVMLRAFRLYLEGEGGHLLQEIDGFADLDAGRGVDFDEVMDKADAIIANARKSAHKRAG